jgi:hypothetical protein
VHERCVIHDISTSSEEAAVVTCAYLPRETSRDGRPDDGFASAIVSKSTHTNNVLTCCIHMLSIQMYLMPKRLVMWIVSLNVLGNSSTDMPLYRASDVVLFSCMNCDLPQQWLSVTYGPLIASSDVWTSRIVVLSVRAAPRSRSLVGYQAGWSRFALHFTCVVRHLSNHIIAVAHDSSDLVLYDLIA